MLKRFYYPKSHHWGITLKDIPGTEIQKLWGNQKNFKPSPASETGLIGLKFIERFNVLFDYKSHKVTLYQGQLRPQLENWDHAPYRGYKSSEW